MTKTFSAAEISLVSVERIQEYMKIESEATWESVDSPPSDWPQRGHVEFQNYSMRYRADLDLTLKDISLDIKPGEKVCRNYYRAVIYNND